MSEGIRDDVFNSILLMFENYEENTEHNNGPEATRELTQAFTLFMLSVAGDHSIVAYQIMTETMAKTYGSYLELELNND